MYLLHRVPVPQLSLCLRYLRHMCGTGVSVPTYAPTRGGISDTSSTLYCVPVSPVGAEVNGDSTALQCSIAKHGSLTAVRQSSTKHKQMC